MSGITILANAEKREVPSIWAEFFTKPTEDPTRSKLAGHAVFVDVEWVKWSRKGQNLAVNENTIRRIQKDDPMVWEVLRPHYEAWQKNQEAPIDGVPLKNWPAISPAQIKTLNGLGIRSVQDLRNMSDGDCDRAGMPGIKNWRARAHAWLEAANDIGKVAEELTQLRARLEKLEEANARLEVANEQLHARLVQTGAVQEPQIKPRKTG